MSQEPKDPAQDRNNASARGARREVDLFPVVTGRESNLAPVATGGGTRGGVEISMFSPVTFEEAVEIVSCLRSRAATTISLDKMKKTDANRLVDFVTGASTALDGDFHKLTEQVYVFCPANIRIIAPTRTAIKSGAGALDYLFPDWKPEKMAGATVPKS